MSLLYIIAGIVLSVLGGLYIAAVSMVYYFDRYIPPLVKLFCILAIGVLAIGIYLIITGIKT